MKCSKCGADNPDNFKFCGQCGEPLNKTRLCPNCGSEVPTEATFCPNCGFAIEMEPKVETLPAISVTWDDNIMSIDQIKVILAEGYNIEASVSADHNQKEQEKPNACISLEFKKGKLECIDYDHPSSRIALSVSFVPEVISHIFKADEHTGRLLHITLCTDVSGEYVFDDEWWKKYGDMFYKDMEPYRQRLKDFFGFDIIEDKYWEEK